MKNPMFQVFSGWSGSRRKTKEQSHSGKQEHVQPLPAMSTPPPTVLPPPPTQCPPAASISSPTHVPTATVVQENTMTDGQEESAFCIPCYSPSSSKQKSMATRPPSAALLLGPRHKELQKAGRGPPTPDETHPKLPVFITDKNFNHQAQLLQKMYPTLPRIVVQLFLESRLPSPWIKFFVDPEFTMEKYHGLRNVENEDQLFELLFRNKMELLSAVSGFIWAVTLFDPERVEVLKRYQSRLLKLSPHVDWLRFIRFHIRFFPQLTSPAPEYAFVENLWERTANDLESGHVPEPRQRRRPVATRGSRPATLHAPNLPWCGSEALAWPVQVR